MDYAERRFGIEPLLGPIVPVTIGLSFAAQDSLTSFGHALDGEPIYAIVSPAEPRTLISRNLSTKLDPKSCLGITTYQSLTQLIGKRSVFVVTINIEGFAPRSIDVVATELLEPYVCVIGRDLLSSGRFTYFGTDAEFSLYLPAPHTI